MIGQRGLIDGFQVIGRDDRLGAHVTEQRDFGALFLGDDLLGAADKHIWLKANGAQLFDGVLGWFGFQLTRCCKIGQKG